MRFTSSVRSRSSVPEASPTLTNNRARRCKPASPRLRYAIEALEPRTLLSAVSWASPSSGDWNNAANWSSDAVPTTSDDVTINMPGVTVTLSGGGAAANSVTSNDPFVLSGGTLTIELNLDLTNTFTLAGGLLNNATVTGTPDELVGSSGGGILSNVTLNVDMLIPDGASVTVENDLALNGGNIDMTGATTNTQLNFVNSGLVSIEGSGSILLDGTAPQFDSILVDDTDGGLSIGGTNGISGTAGTITTTGTGGTFEIDGTLSANGSGGGITLSGPDWDNEGTFEAVNGGSLTINTTVAGGGQFVENNSALTLGGTVMSTSVVQRTAGIVNLTGTLQSDGGTETFDNTTGSWNLVGGTVSDCTLVFTSGNSIVPTADPGIFDNVSLDSDLTIGSGANLDVITGLTLNSANITIASAPNSAGIEFIATSALTVGGTGQIIFAGSDPSQNYLIFDNAGAGVTIGANVSIVGSAGTITAINVGGNLTLDGAITANTSGDTITLTDGAMDLQGTAQAINGGILTVNSNLSIEGSLTETDSTLNLGYTISNSDNMDHISQDGGAINLTGSLNFFGLTATFAAVTGSWNLLGGTVSNTVLAFAGGNSLIPTTAGGTFSNVTLDNDLDVPAGAMLNVVNGLTLSSAALTIEASAQVNFNNTNVQMLSGTGTVDLNGGTFNSSDGGTSGLTIASGVLVSGFGTIDLGSDDVLQGTISANNAVQPLQIDGQSANNQGTVQAVNGAVLNIDPDLGSGGTITETNSIINFAGSLSSLPTVVQSGGMVVIAGVLDLGGVMQTFDDTTGTWYFSGTVANGTLTFSGNGALIPEGASPTLDGITVDSEFTVPDGVDLFIRDGLTINSLFTIASNGSPTTLTFDNSSSQSLDGTSQLVFGGASPTNNTILVDDSIGSLTVTPSVVISGTSGTIQTSGAGGNLILQGVISANNVGGTIVVQGPGILYQGTMQALGGTLDVNGDFQASHTGSVNILIGDGMAGQFNVTGNAALDGTLNIIVANGYVPPQGSMYNIVTYGAVTGAFATVNGLTSGGVTFDQTVGPTAFQIVVTSGGGQASGLDLFIMTLADSGGAYQPGDTLNGSGVFSFTGQGEPASMFNIEVLLSPDGVLGTTDDVVLENVPETAVPGSFNVGFQIQAPIPANTPPGSYGLIAFIDSTNAVAESNETNNVFVSALNDIVVTAAPPAPSMPTDLSLSGVSYSAGTYNTGDPFEISATANNSGPGGEASYSIDFVLSEDGVFGDRDNIFLDTITNNGYSGADSGSGSVQGTVPAGIPAGSYHLLARIYSNDPAADIVGSDNIYVSPQADIVIPAPAVAPAPQPVKIGSPDPNFGINGLAAHNVGITTTSDVAVQPDGDSVILGTSGTAGAGDFALTRYTANGSLDTTFGNQGTVTTDFGGDDQAAAVYILPDGKILAVGTSNRMVNGQSAGSEFAIARYNADGSLDTTFGSGTGMVLTSFSSSSASSPSTDIARAIAVLANGAFYVAGSSNAAGSNPDFAVAAYNSDGSLLTSFGGTGKALVDFSGGNDSANAIAIQKNRDLVLAGSTQNPTSGITSIALARLLPSGALDKTFGTKGRVTKNLRNVDDEASSVALQKDGQIIVGGFSATGSAADNSLSTDFALVRFTSTGRVSASFGHGSVITDFGQPSAITKILIQPDGKIVASGKTTASIDSLVANQLDVALARYNIDGTLDKTFSATGTALITLAGSEGAERRAIVTVESTSTLMDQFNALKQSDQGALATNQGGELFDVGISGADTVEAAVITTGVDLAARVMSTVKSSIIDGAKGAASIKITNAGPDAAEGAVTVSLFTSSDATGGSSAMLIQALHPNLRLKLNQSESFKFSFSFPGGLANGSYYLVGQVNPGSLPETNVANNTAASGAIHIAKASVELTGSGLIAPASVAAGATITVPIKVANSGNIPAVGTTSIEFLASSDGTLASGITLATVANVHLSLKPGASKAFKESFAVPSSLPAGQYDLLALLDPNNSLGESSAADNLVVSAMKFTV